MEFTMGRPRRTNNRAKLWIYPCEPVAMNAASSVRELTPSFRYTFERFHATVFGLRLSSEATSWFLRPATTSSTIRRSVSES